jgi:hypothetical protein
VNFSGKLLESRSSRRLPRVFSPRLLQELIFR